MGNGAVVLRRASKEESEHPTELGEENKGEEGELDEQLLFEPFNLAVERGVGTGVKLCVNCENSIPFVGVATTTHSAARKAGTARRASRGRRGLRGVRSCREGLAEGLRSLRAILVRQRSSGWLLG